MNGKTKRTKLRRYGVGCAMAGLLSFGGLAPAWAASIQTVDITRFAYGPAEITIKPGTQVTWINHDQIPHTVTSKDKGGVLASQALDTDDRYSYTFTKVGDYAYYCTVHPFMTGMVHVRQ